LKDYREAIQSWKRAFNLVPQKTHYLIYIARAYEKLKDWVQAESYYRKALQVRPDDGRTKKALTALVERRKTKK
jgi:tetratricopeptide (TPR) repeat protein